VLLGTAKLDESRAAELLGSLPPDLIPQRTEGCKRGQQEKSLVQLIWIGLGVIALHFGASFMAAPIQDALRVDSPQVGWEVTS
jgi:hypothetical protein